MEGWLNDERTLCSPSINKQLFTEMSVSPVVGKFEAAVKKSRLKKL